jgi:hypothetical protein
MSAVRALREYVNLMSGRSQEKVNEFIFARQSLEKKSSFSSFKKFALLYELLFVVCCPLALETKVLSSIPDYGIINNYNSYICCITVFGSNLMKTANETNHFLTPLLAQICRRASTNLAISSQLKNCGTEFHRN